MEEVDPLGSVRCFSTNHILQTKRQALIKALQDGKTPEQFFEENDIKAACCRTNLSTSVDINQKWLVSHQQYMNLQQLRIHGIRPHQQYHGFTPLTEAQEGKYFTMDNSDSNVRIDLDTKQLVKCAV